MNNNTIRLEIPAGVDQDSLWQLEDKLKEIEGVQSTNLEEKKDLLAAANLAIQLIGSGFGVVGGTIALAETYRKTAKKLHEFLHPEKATPAPITKPAAITPTTPPPLPVAQTAALKKVVIVKPDGSRVELYGLSEAEIEQEIKKLHSPA